MHEPERGAADVDQALDRQRQRPVRARDEREDRRPVELLDPPGRDRAVEHVHRDPDDLALLLADARRSRRSGSTARTAGRSRPRRRPARGGPSRGRRARPSRCQRAWQVELVGVVEEADRPAGRARGGPRAWRRTPGRAGRRRGRARSAGSCRARRSARASARSERARQQRHGAWIGNSDEQEQPADVGQLEQEQDAQA